MRSLPGYVSFKEATHLLGKSHVFVRKMIRAGAIGGVYRVNRRVIWIRLEALCQFAAKHPQYRSDYHSDLVAPLCSGQLYVPRDKMLKMKEAAGFLGCSDKHLRRLARSGELREVYWINARVVLCAVSELRTYRDRLARK